MEKEKNKSISVKNCTIITNLEHLEFEKLEKTLKRNCIDKYAYIIHDKDVYTQKEVDENLSKPKEKQNPNVVLGGKKKIHIHICLKFKDTQKIEYISKWLGIPQNLIQKLRGSWVTTLRYLTHMNHPEKYQYKPEEVVCNFDFLASVVITEGKGSSNRKNREREIINLIETQTVKEYNMHDYISAIEHHEHKRAIDNTFNYVMRRLEITKKDRDMRVIYINGESGAGKSTYAKKMAEDKGYSLFVSSSSNDILDSYKGQDCILLDDFREDSMSFPDLLKLLDNHTNSTVKSRFKNKNLVYCKLIIITSTLPLEKMIDNLSGTKGEDLTQLKRRIGLSVYLTSEKMDLYVYDKNVKQHVLKHKDLENPVIEYIKSKQDEENKNINDLMDIIGLDKIKKYKSNETLEEFS